MNRGRWNVLVPISSRCSRAAPSSSPPPREKDRRERDIRLRALCPPRAHTLGYIGGCDQEQGVLECPPPALLYHEKTWGAGRFARELSRSFPLSHHVWGIEGDDVGSIQSTNHQQPDVNYIQVLEKDDSPCTVNAQHLPFKGNQLRAQTG